MGLILCLAILPVMLCFHGTMLEIIITVASLNCVFIAVRLLTGTWANGVDAAVFLEQQYKTPGLFITAADLLAKAETARETGRHDAEIIFDAAHRCQRRPAMDTRILLSTSADLRIWAANGLLVIALVITAEVGQAVVRHVGGRAVPGVSQKASRVASGVAVTAPARHLPEVNSSTKMRRTPAMQNAPLKGRSEPFAQQRTIDAIKQIKGAITHLLLAAKIKDHGPVDHPHSKGTGKHGDEALQAQLLAAARLPGVGTKTQTMLLAAAHALHASSKGNFIPLLHRINRQLEDYLALATGRSDAIRRGYDTNGNSSGAGNNTSRTNHTGSGAGKSDLADQVGDSGNAIVTDIPSGQNPGPSTALRWGRSKPVDNAKIPLRYRSAVERYFSGPPTPNAR